MSADLLEQRATGRPFQCQSQPGSYRAGVRRAGEVARNPFYENEPVLPYCHVPTWRICSLADRLTMGILRTSPHFHLIVVCIIRSVRCLRTQELQYAASTVAYLSYDGQSAINLCSLCAYLHSLSWNPMSASRRNNAWLGNIMHSL